jgi:hypothetical protein
MHTETSEKREHAKNSTLTLEAPSFVNKEISEIVMSVWSKL